jgi:hypothetical protein
MNLASNSTGSNNVTSDNNSRRNSCQLTLGNQSKSSLSCLYFNARSIMNKLDEIELIITDEKLDVVAITETWLSDSVLTSEITVDGYTVLRKDRNDVNKTRGGGVALYIKNEINILERVDLYEQLFPESIWCNILFKGEKH